MVAPMNPMLERIVILGAKGQLGADLLEAVADVKPIGIERKFVDVEDADAVAVMMRTHRPTLVVNATAYHQVDLCELHPERAFAVNALAVDRLAALCALSGSAFLTVSSDYVFDGTLGRAYREDDMPRPLSVYGASKAAGEMLVPRHGPRYFIVRTSGLFGHLQSSVKGLTFIERMLRMAEEGKPIRVVDDIVFSPSYTPHVARAIRAIVESERFGLYHVTNAGSCSWYEFAAEAFACAGLQPDFQASKTDPKAGYVRRPAYSPLEGAAMREAGLPSLPDWRDAVRDYVTHRAPTARS